MVLSKNAKKMSTGQEHKFTKKGAKMLFRKLAYRKTMKKVLHRLKFTDEVIKKTQEKINKGFLLSHKIVRSCSILNYQKLCQVEKKRYNETKKNN